MSLLYSLTRRVLLLAALAWPILVFAACRSMPEPSDNQDGFLVLEDTLVASQLGVSPGTEVPEVLAIAVPRSVGRRAAEIAQSLRFDEECTRFFRGRTGWMSLLRTTCPDAATFRVRGGVALVVLDRDGEVVAQLGDPPGVISRLQPYWRGPQSQR
jgi:hypothetical protein